MGVNNKSLHWDLLHIQDKRNIRKQQISLHWDLVEKKYWRYQKEYRGAVQIFCAFSWDPHSFSECFVMEKFSLFWSAVKEWRCCILLYEWNQEHKSLSNVSLSL